MIFLERIISGGQTGADQGALDGAIACGFPHGGAVPAGRKTEAGPLSLTYRMEELHSESYAKRTEKNVEDADGTIILSHGTLSGGSALTKNLALKHKKPCLHVDFTRLSHKDGVVLVFSWLEMHGIRILNVAGPRASSDPRIHNMVRNLIISLLNEMRRFENGDG